MTAPAPAPKVWTRADLAALASIASPTQGQLVHLVAVLEGLARLEERGQVPASSRMVRAITWPPLYGPACPILGLGRALGLAELEPSGPTSSGGWRLTDAGRRLVLEPHPGGPPHART